jgi:hypothetical protein
MPRIGIKVESMPEKFHQIFMVARIQPLTRQLHHGSFGTVIINLKEKERDSYYVGI